jgi:hypothetical protein
MVGVVAYIVLTFFKRINSTMSFGYVKVMCSVTIVTNNNGLYNDMIIFEEITIGNGNLMISEKKGKSAL